MKAMLIALWMVVRAVMHALRVKRRNWQINNRLEFLGTVNPEIGIELMRIEIERDGLPAFVESMTGDRRTFMQIVADYIGEMVIKGDRGLKRRKGGVVPKLLLGCLLLTAYCSLASAQVYDPPGGCRNTDGSQRACKWYERSYLLPKAQQEQLLPVLLERVLGGNLGINTDPAPRVIDDTARVAAIADDDDMISVSDAAVMLNLSRSRVHKLAGDMGLPLRLAKRGRNHVVVFTPAEVERMANRGTRPYRKRK